MLLICGFVQNQVYYTFCDSNISYYIVCTLIFFTWLSIVLYQNDLKIYIYLKVLYDLYYEVYFVVSAFISASILSFPLALTSQQCFLFFKKKKEKGGILNEQHLPFDV